MTVFKLRRGISSLWSSNNPVLADGEPGYDKTNKRLKIGDGSTAWSSLAEVGSSTYVGAFAVDPILAGQGSAGATAVTAAINGRLQAAKAAGGGVVWLPAGNFTINDTLRLPSKVEIRGAGPLLTLITQIANDKAIIASENWVSASGVSSPSGSSGVVDLAVHGNQSGANQHGVVIRDYYSRIHNVHAQYTGGDGFRVDANDDAGAIVGFTCVENRYSGLLASFNGGYGFNSPVATTRMTDSFLSDFVCDGRTAAGTLGGLRLTVSAGWQIRNIHTYGAFTGAAVVVNQAWNTILDGAQIESGFGTYGLAVTSFQRASSFDNLSISCNGGTNTHALYAEKGGVDPGMGFNVGNLHIVQDSDVAVTGVSWDSLTCPVRIGNLSTSGAHAERITKIGGFGASSVLVASDVKTTQAIRESLTGATLTVGGTPLALANRADWSGNTAQSKNFTLPRLLGWTQFNALVMVSSATNYNGGKQAVWVGHVLISSKNNATDAWSAYVTDVVAASGFTVAPVVTATHTLGQDNGVINVSFTGSSASAYGSVGILYGFS